ncbi:DUF4328 domain-containing protein [Hyphomonas sp.]|uniref:DUF4328 domain-containing protein n=1 Tax=Hyphomonas sp. TaxID=87 RepID=UPI003528E0B4
MDAVVGADYAPKRMTTKSRYAYDDEVCRPVGPFESPLRIMLLIYAILAGVRALVLSYGIFDPRMMMAEEIETGDTSSLIAGIASLAYLGLYLIGMLLFCACAFLVGRFTYRAMRNLYTVRSTTPEISPIGTILWYLVPFANLVMPANAMSQIHHGSIEETGSINVSNLVSWWWGAWLTGNILTNIGSFVLPNAIQAGIGLTVVAILLNAAAALTLRKLLHRIRTAQDSFTIRGLADAFD